MDEKNPPLRIGWAQTDITPEETVQVAGQFHARVSEGVENPLTATVMALDAGDDHAVLVSVDVVSISDPLRDRIRARVVDHVKDLDPMKLIINATHTHTGPQMRIPGGAISGVGSAGPGVDLETMDVSACVDFVAARVARAVTEAWNHRQPGGIAFGLGHAVVGHNRRWVNERGESTMYNLNGNDDFRHLEGYEDHSLNVLATYNADDELTGVVVNVPCPSQVTEGNFTLSADYWHETRQALRQWLGEHLFILPQCSAAGDQAPRPMYEKSAHERMLRLQGRTRREELGRRIAGAVADMLPAIAVEIDRAPTLHHDVATVELPMNRLTQADADDARREAEKYRVEYEAEKKKLDDHPELRDQPRWYVEVTRAYRKMRWHEGVIQRFERQWAGATTLPAEVHVLRIGEIALASVPFEYYLDFGIQIKVRSPAMQTFIVQLAGNGTYLPSPRSVAGGGYGSVPASCMVGPEAGQILADHILRQLDQWFGEN